jgi:NitT/TauT family transport system substrate-binding protein
MSLFRRTAQAIALGIAALSGAALAQPAPERMNYTLPWLPVGDYAYYTAGVANGFYREEGIDLTINRGFGSIDVVNKLAAGAFTLGEADISAIIAGRVRQNIPVRCIAANQTMNPHALLVLEGSGINTMKDLEGRSIATQPGNAMLLFFPLIAAANNIDVSRVRVINVEAAAMAGMLLNGRADAAAFFATNTDFLNRQAQQIGRQVKALRYADYGVQIYAQCIAATEEAIAQRGDLLRRVVRATIRARLWARDNPEETARMHVRRFPEVNYDDALMSWRAAIPYIFNANTDRDGQGQFNAALLESTYRTVATAQQLDPGYDWRTLVDTSLLAR